MIYEPPIATRLHGAQNLGIGRTCPPSASVDQFKIAPEHSGTALASSIAIRARYALGGIFGVNSHPITTIDGRVEQAWRRADLPPRRRPAVGPAPIDVSRFGGRDTRWVTRSLIRIGDILPDTKSCTGAKMDGSALSGDLPQVWTGAGSVSCIDPTTAAERRQCQQNVAALEPPFWKLFGAWPARGPHGCEIRSPLANAVQALEQSDESQPNRLVRCASVSEYHPTRPAEWVQCAKPRFPPAIATEVWPPCPVSTRMAWSSAR